MSALPLEALLSTPIDHPLSQVSVAHHLSRNPWHQVAGTFNFRSVSYPPRVRSDFIYRSGMISMLSEEGRKEVKDILGITTVFDLRSGDERATDPEPTIAGVNIVHSQSLGTEGVAHQDTQWKSLVDMYVHFLDTHSVIYRDIFTHVIQKPNEPFLVHCTGVKEFNIDRKVNPTKAGKDRTAVIIALLLAIAGVPREIIAHDFALTRIGVEPVRELLQAKFAGLEGKEIDWHSEEVRMIAGCEASTMFAFLEALDNPINGGLDCLIQRKFDLERKEVDLIRLSLRG